MICNLAYFGLTFRRIANHAGTHRIRRNVTLRFPLQHSLADEKSLLGVNSVRSARESAGTTFGVTV